MNANIEELPFPDSFFDVVASAGSLSYSDPKIVDSEIFRVLREKGTVILTDALHHNPIYKLNRFRHYLLRHRSFSTITWTPNMQRLREYEKKYIPSQLYFFGAYLWVFKLVKPFFGHHRALNLFNYLESLHKLESSAFKFIFVGQKLSD